MGNEMLLLMRLGATNRDGTAVNWKGGVPLGELGGTPLGQQDWLAASGKNQGPLVAGAARTE
jgi:hypothetical protein